MSIKTTKDISPLNKVTRGKYKISYRKVVIRDEESIEEALRRFKHECERSGILKDIKRREFYEAPSVTKKLKAQELRRKLRKNKK
jgi:small subunit ribosomal protein S21